MSKLVFNADTTCRNTPWAEFLVPRCDTSVVQIGSVDAGVHQEFILVNFTDFGEGSLDILVYYFTSSTAWLDHMDIRQRINVKIMKAIQERGLSDAKFAV